ncbi:MAG: peptidylprolyl isomerase [Mycobacteriaceae bacterium]
MGLALTGCGGGSGDAPPTSPSSSTQAATSTTSAPSNAKLGGTFARATPLPPTVSCDYPASGSAAKPNAAPPTRDVPTQGPVPVRMTTTAGDIGLSLDRALAPCTVNAFLSLAKQNYFDGTGCHRLVTSGIYVLQCGDPTATGKGGPGYVYANEYPTDQYPPNDPRLAQTVNYPRGTIAMANVGKPTTNGSQFFLVYADSPLPPQYTVFGTIDDAGLADIDKVAAGGEDGSMGAAGGGAPKTPVTITTVSTGR